MTRDSLAYAEDTGAEVTSPLLPARSIELGANVTDCAFSADGSRLFATLGDGRVAVIGGVGTSALERADLAPHRVAAVCVRRLGETMITAGQDGRVMAIGADGSGPRAVWDAGDTWIEALAVHEPTAAIAIAAGKRLVIARADGTIVCAAEIDTTISGLAFDGAGRRVALSRYDGVTIVDAATGGIDAALSWKGSHIAVAWSPDSRYVVTATQEKQLHVWDLVTMQDFRIGGYPRKTHQMTWTGDGRVLACSGADVITAWSFAGAGPGGRPPVEIGFVFGGFVTAVCAHPSVPILAGGFSTGHVLVGATQKGEALVAQTRTGVAITALAWCPRGATLAAADRRGRVGLFGVPATLGVS